ISWVVIDQFLRFGNTRVGAVHNMIPGSGGFLFRNGAAPFFPRQKLELSFLPEPGSDCLCISAQANSGRRYDIEFFADACTPMRDRPHKTLSNIGGVDMMHGF